MTAWGVRMYMRVDGGGGLRLELLRTYLVCGASRRPKMLASGCLLVLLGARLYLEEVLVEQGLGLPRRLWLLRLRAGDLLVDLISH